MPGLIADLIRGMREELNRESVYKTHPALRRLVNEVIEDDTDFEHLITFLGDARSAIHRRFAESLRTVFSTVLRTRLDSVEAELGGRRSGLYAALIDMHDLPGVREDLVGFLTLNYDGFLEHAIETQLGRSVDYGIAIGSGRDGSRPIRVLKLHGSFSWSDEWPIQGGKRHDHELWIPPGIRKAKSEYPFNLIWGRAREMLDCDVLRIVGCNLGPNDWDLVSMLFTTMHTHATDGPYRIEVIAGPKTADRIAEQFPYLNVVSILELPVVGPLVVSENLGGAPIPFEELSDEEKEQAKANVQSKARNAFAYWLQIKGEAVNERLDDLNTDAGLFREFIEGSY